MTTIKNIKRIVSKNCDCGNWLDHWLTLSNAIAKRCAACGCSNKTNLQGVHVQKTLNNNLWYIVPLCPNHAKENIELAVSDSTLFISADPTETCAKFKFNEYVIYNKTA